MNLLEFQTLVVPECPYVNKAITWAMLTDDPFGDEGAPLRNQISREEARTLVEWMQTLTEQERSPKLQEFYQKVDQLSRGILYVHPITKGFC